MHSVVNLLDKDVQIDIFDILCERVRNFCDLKLITWKIHFLEREKNISQVFLYLLKSTNYRKQQFHFTNT